MYISSCFNNISISPGAYLLFLVSYNITECFGNILKLSKFQYEKFLKISISLTCLPSSFDWLMKTKNFINNIEINHFDFLLMNLKKKASHKSLT